MDVYLAQLVESLGGWVYVLVFLVIFLETGVVVAPWLPGESLLIAAGSLAGGGYLDIAILGPLLFGAAFLGDLSNYLIGRFVGGTLMARPRRYLRARHVAQAHEFYEKYGGRAIVFARFMPIVRTLAPFVAGAARMDFRRFLFFDAVASLAWVTIFVGTGYWFGSISWVRDNLALMLLGVVLLSITPSVIGFLIKWVRARRARRPVATAEPPDGSGAASGADPEDRTRPEPARPGEDPEEEARADAARADAARADAARADAARQGEEPEVRAGDGGCGPPGDRM